MKSEYKCLICGEKYGSHITAMHKLLKLMCCIKIEDEADEGQTNIGFDDDDESILIENN